MYVDSSFATEADRRSIFGYLVLLNDCVLLYKSKAQPIVTLSTTESDFVAVALGLRDMKWTLNVLHELRLCLDVVVVYCDNQGALKILTNNSATGRTRHVDIKLQFARVNFIKGPFVAKYVDTKDQVADLFTKPLNHLSFDKLASRLLYDDPKLVADSAN